MLSTDCVVFNYRVINWELKKWVAIKKKGIGKDRKLTKKVVKNLMPWPIYKM